MIVIDRLLLSETQFLFETFYMIIGNTIAMLLNMFYDRNAKDKLLLIIIWICNQEGNDHIQQYYNLGENSLNNNSSMGRDIKARRKLDM